MKRSVKRALLIGAGVAVALNYVYSRGTIDGASVGRRVGWEQGWNDCMSAFEKVMKDVAEESSKGV